MARGLAPGVVLVPWLCGWLAVGGGCGRTELVFTNAETDTAGTTGDSDDGTTGRPGLDTGPDDTGRPTTGPSTITDTFTTGPSSDTDSGPSTTTTTGPSTTTTTDTSTSTTEDPSTSTTEDPSTSTTDDPTTSTTDGDTDTDTDGDPTCLDAVDCVLACGGPSPGCINMCDDGLSPAEDADFNALEFCIIFACITNGSCPPGNFGAPACVACRLDGQLDPSTVGCEAEAAACAM